MAKKKRPTTGTFVIECDLVSPKGYVRIDPPGEITADSLRISGLKKHATVFTAKEIEPAINGCQSVLSGYPYMGWSCWSVPHKEM